MESIGTYLRREREIRHVSLEELAQTTRIPLRNLLLIEDDRFDELPGDVFARGFLRAYARAVGADDDAIVVDDEAGEARGEYRAELVLSLVEPAGVPGVQRVEESGRRDGAGERDEVDVIRHDGVRERDPVGRGRPLAEAAEVLGAFLVAGNPEAVVDDAGDEVLDGAGGGEAEETWHADVLGRPS